jgi:hypothetical protein
MVVYSELWWETLMVVKLAKSLDQKMAVDLDLYWVKKMVE